MPGLKNACEARVTASAEYWSACKAEVGAVESICALYLFENDTI